MKKIIELQNIKRNFQVGDETVHALRGISFTIYEGEFVTIMGTSGSGKSTLLNTLGCLDTPTSGEYLLDGVSVRTMSKPQRAVLRNRKIGFVFQNYNLLPILNVYENITLPMKLDGMRVDEEFLNHMIDRLKLREKLYHMPETLSGGQQQRVAIARALSTKPAVLLCDEPTGNLDSVTGMEVVGLLKSSAYEFHQTIVVVTHNEEIAQMADRIIRIEDGKVKGDTYEE